MLKEADLSNLSYTRLDGEEVGLLGLTRSFAPVHEELIITVPASKDEVSRNREFVMGFIRDGQTFELCAFMILQDIEYRLIGTSVEKVLRFTSLGGYTIALADLKD